LPMGNTIAYCPWTIRENSSFSATNQIARFIKTNAWKIKIRLSLCCFRKLRTYARTMGKHVAKVRSKFKYFPTE
jgi:hypothetical protein